MKILQIAQSERGGGASKVALNLHRGYLSAGHDARLLVKFPAIKTPGLFAVDAFSETAPWAPMCKSLDRIVGQFGPFRGQRRLRELFWGIAWPTRLRDRWLGVEDFNYPYSHRLFDLAGWSPEVIQLHNISTGFFDLRALKVLSRKRPVILTLHDSWAFTGHCGHPIDCRRWRTGCGQCPDLERFPPVRRDKTSYNWQRKKEIYAESSLYVASPSRWLLDIAQESILVARDYRLVANGIDLNCFSPADKDEAKGFLDLPKDAFVCLYVSAIGAGNDAYKDYSTVRDSIIRVEKIACGVKIFFVCVGGQTVTKNSSGHRYVGYIKDSGLLRRYYQAADLFLHAANAETFGLTVAEAQACGTPVVATAVGGIPEIVQHERTGFLVPRHGSNEMADCIVELAMDRQTCRRMGEVAANFAGKEFELQTQVRKYLEWFDQLRACDED